MSWRKVAKTKKNSRRWRRRRRYGDDDGGGGNGGPGDDDDVTNPGGWKPGRGDAERAVTHLVTEVMVKMQPWIDQRSRDARLTR